MSNASQPLIFAESPAEISHLRMRLNQNYRREESACIDVLLQELNFSPESQQRIYDTAYKLVEKVRHTRLNQGGIDAFLCEYDLSSDEGIALMCLAEALLRIPDKSTIDKLIRDKISAADWVGHRGKSESFLVNVATWGLILTGKMYSREEAEEKSKSIGNVLTRLLERSSEPVVRQAIAQAVKILSRQFVMGQTIEEAIQRARAHEKKGYRYSYDMLGEQALTQADAEMYLAAYQHAIQRLSEIDHQSDDIMSRPGISIKLSALHPRYQYAKRERVLEELTPRLFTLVLQAKNAGIGLTVDAEESDRLDLSLDVIEAVFSDPALNGWEGFGLAVQSYQKRAWYLIDWLADLAERNKRRIVIRLIKGAYWDSEIKWAQERGLEGYPVFTRKACTDVSFLACAKKIINYGQLFYPQFATHNAHSVASVLEMIGERKDFEFQCLHGMGYTLYDQVVGAENLNIPARVYAPVGGHEQLLSYLVRRLLENGANTSFVNRIIDAETPIEQLLISPIEKVKNYSSKAHPKIPLPKDLYGPRRKNSQGIDLSRQDLMMSLSQKLQHAVNQSWRVAPIIGGEEHANQSELKAVFSPINNDWQIGYVQQATSVQVAEAIERAHKATFAWDNTPVEKRAEYLEAAAVLFEKHHEELMALLIREGGKTIPDAIAEVREAVDFCRYYANQARDHFAPKIMPGPTGESNQLHLHGRGVFGCISPWNFPLAIFTGQVTAALVAGNCVIAKPAAQTPLVAGLAVRLLHAAGIPGDVLQLLPGRGAVVGDALVKDERIAGILFTGSTETARQINQHLAARKGGGIVPFIAETGGQNAMIVDSSALAEQVVNDVIISAFSSAGQRCSALRVLFLQDEIADKTIEMLKGAMAELTVADPGLLATDVGPIIDRNARDGLLAHQARMEKEGQLIYQVPLTSACEKGSYFAPCAFEIKSLSQLPEEIFGPVLHIIRYKSNELDKVIEEINATGYGLTIGIHSRIKKTVDYICKRVHVGNIYVNRNMIGAVVGVQAFGGEGLSGTGPKAGGPHYLLRMVTERTICINTTASGGNASLMSLDDGE